MPPDLFAFPLRPCMAKALPAYSPPPSGRVARLLENDAFATAH